VSGLPKRQMNTFMGRLGKSEGRRPHHKAKKDPSIHIHKTTQKSTLRQKHQRPDFYNYSYLICTHQKFSHVEMRSLCKSWCCDREVDGAIEGGLAKTGLYKRQDNSPRCHREEISNILRLTFAANTTLKREGAFDVSIEAPLLSVQVLGQARRPKKPAPEKSRSAVLLPLFMLYASLPFVRFVQGKLTNYSYIIF